MRPFVRRLLPPLKPTEDPKQTLAMDRLIAAMHDFNRAVEIAASLGLHLVAEHADSGRFASWSIRRLPVPSKEECE